MATDVAGWIYTIHFDRPVSPHHTAQHYTGWAKDPWQRLEQHRRGWGPKYTRLAAEQGIGFTLVDLRQGTRNDERRLKNQGGASRRCPVCKGKCANGEGAEWLPHYSHNTPKQLTEKLDVEFYK